MFVYKVKEKEKAVLEDVVSEVTEDTKQEVLELEDMQRSLESVKVGVNAETGWIVTVGSKAAVGQSVVDYMTTV